MATRKWIIWPFGTKYDESTTVYVEALKRKTNVELAQEILTKNGYCVVHLTKKQPQFEIENVPSNRLVFMTLEDFEPICLECLKEAEARCKLEQDKKDVARDLEIEFALNVMRESIVCKSK